MKLCIIGGAGELGRLFAKELKKFFNDIIITDIDERRGVNVSKELGVKFVRDNKEACKISDIIFLSVPMRSAYDVLNEIRDYLKEDSLLIDLFSVKGFIHKFLKELKCEVISIHPMFSPRVKSFEGQLFIIIPIKTNKWLKFVLNLIERFKARYIITDVEKHDRIMSIVQCLTHFIYLSLAKTLKEVGLDIKDLENYSSPIFKLTLDIMSRIIGQNPSLYIDIQLLNRYSSDIRNLFINCCIKLNDLFNKSDVKELEREIISYSKFFKNIEKNIYRSDKAIELLTHEYKKLLKLMGKEIAVRNLSTGKIHIGRLLDVNPERIVLKTNGKITYIKTENVELLSDKDKVELKFKAFAKKIRDYSILIDENFDENFLIKLLEKLFPEARFKLIDIYRSDKFPPGKKSVTIRVEYIDINLKEIENFFEKIGAKIR